MKTWAVLFVRMGVAHHGQHGVPISIDTHPEIVIAGCPMVEGKKLSFDNGVAEYEVP